MNIGIVGLGVVGNALYQVLDDKFQDIKRYDPAKGYYDKLTDADVIFICINDKNKDMSSTREAVKRVVEENKKAIIVLRTTILPGTTDSLILEHKRIIVFMPEFLREWNVTNDMINPDKIVIGTEDNEAFETLINIFKSNKDIVFTDDIIQVKPIEAEIAKLALNSLYLIKVVYAEQLFDVIKKYDCDYKNIYRIFQSDRQINERHLIPKHDGYRGAGGKCLPKDSNFMLHIAKLKEKDGMELLKIAIKLNKGYLKEGK
ncbi:unnamed protein product [marine sediment metagenome]|uniref:UDP-glucose/GDP-mannose dehydrogenase dimerisation domain-containing protein n=1 Tax=marine sediment metagenome TaxID=412755 RepID=X1MI54_9ZZZZ